MKYITVLLFLFLFLATVVSGQGFNKSISKDSLFQTILKDLPEDKKEVLLKIYNEGSEREKEFFLVMFSMPRSSKEELISNIDSNFEKIIILKSSYLKLVPKGYVVSIEFNPENIITMSKETIDLRIEQIKDKQRDIKQEWNLDYNSEKLAQMIKPLNWTNGTLMNIKKLLVDANCISIENSDITTIGFARSGMGKYFFKLFNNDLTTEQIKKYNDKCSYIFYKKNIVLEYGGGAVGSSCFSQQ